METECSFPSECIIFSTIVIDYSFAAHKVIISSLKVCRLNIREVREDQVPGHWGGNSRAFGIGFSPTPTHSELATTTLQPSQPNPSSL